MAKIFPNKCQIWSKEFLPAKTESPLVDREGLSGKSNVLT